MNKNKRPIAIYDSGLGGLYIFKEIKKILPQENLLYFADTKNLPYGDKDEKTIIEISKKNIQLLLSYNIKMLVIACNTISVCITNITTNYDVPIIDMIAPQITALSSIDSKKLTMIGTLATIKSNKYQSLIKNIFPNIELTSVPCPLFVPTIENQNHPATIKKLIHEYLSFLKNKTGTLILACTHYSALINALKKHLGENITIIDPAIFCAQEVKKNLLSLNLQNTDSEKPNYRFLTSSSTLKFKKKANQIFDLEIAMVEKFKKSLL